MVEVFHIASFSLPIPHPGFEPSPEMGLQEMDHPLTVHGQGRVGYGGALPRTWYCLSLGELKRGLFGPGKEEGLSRKQLFNTSVGKMSFLLAISSSCFTCC